MSTARVNKNQEGGEQLLSGNQSSSKSRMFYLRKGVRDTYISLSYFTIGYAVIFGSGLYEWLIGSTEGIEGYFVVAIVISQAISIRNLLTLDK